MSRINVHDVHAVCQNCMIHSICHLFVNIDNERSVKITNNDRRAMPNVYLKY